MRRALVLLTAVGLATATAACASGTGGNPSPVKEGKAKATTTSAAAFDGEVLGAGEVVRVDKLDGIRLESPDDGRVRNYGVAVDVVDFGTAEVVDAGVDVRYGAEQDATLLAFRLRVTPFADDLAPKVTATVSVDGRQRSLPDFEYALDTAGEDGTLQYLVGVPNDRRDVELELKYADVAQRFDLLEGERTGEQPEILYRSPDAPSVYVENLTPAKFPVADEDAEAGTYVVAVTRAELTYFTVPLGDVPAADDKAWLVVHVEPTGEGSLQYSPDADDCVLPFAAFTLSDGTTTYPVVDKHSAMREHDEVKTLVFEVPAGLTDATLTVRTTGFNCLNAGSAEPYTASGEAVVAMTLPED